MPGHHNVQKDKLVNQQRRRERAQSNRCENFHELLH
jgi:hypothetical protein